MRADRPKKRARRESGSSAQEQATKVALAAEDGRRHRDRMRDEDMPPPRLKARVYTALINAQQETGPLVPLAGSERNGYGLCSFERLVEIAPLPARATEAFLCRCCHPRLLAEHLDSIPLRWAHCPYCNFQRG